MSQREDIVCDLIDEVRAEIGAALGPAISERIELRLRLRWGGRAVYVRKRDVDEAAVRAEYDGRNRRELQAKHQISRAHFYRIVKGG